MEITDKDNASLTTRNTNQAVHQQFSFCVSRRRHLESDRVPSFFVSSVANPATISASVHQRYLERMLAGGDRKFAGKPTADDIKLWNWFKRHIDPVDTSLNRTVDGPQAPNWALNKHFQSHPKQRTLIETRRYHVQLHRRYPEATIHGKSKFDYRQPVIALRIDADAHKQGQQLEDCKEFIDRVKSLPCIGGRLYSEASPHGHSGYATIPVSSYTHYLTGETRFTPRWQVNKHLDELQKALSRLAAAWGLKIDIEVQGKFNETGHTDDGCKIITTRAHPMRLPKCPNPGDIDRLINSTFPDDSVIDQLIRLGKLQLVVTPAPVIATPVIPTSEQRRAGHKLDRKIDRTMKVLDPTEKHEKRVQCVKEKYRTILPPSQWDGSNVTDPQIETILEQAHQLYVSRGWNTGTRDKERDAAFKRILRWLFASFDPERQSNSGGKLWFTADAEAGEVSDVEHVDRMWRSIFSVKALEELNASNPKLKHTPIRFPHLAIATCFTVKNVLTNGGAVSHDSIMRGLLYFGLRLDDQACGILRTLLVQHGFITRTHRKYGPGMCRKYTVEPKGYNLPFVAHLKEQRERYLQGTAGGQHHTDTTSISLYRQSITINTSPDSDIPDPFDPAWQVVEAQLQAEYMEMYSIA